MGCIYEFCVRKYLRLLEKISDILKRRDLGYVRADKLAGQLVFNITMLEGIWGIIWLEAAFVGVCTDRNVLYKAAAFGIVPVMLAGGCVSLINIFITRTERDTGRFREAAHIHMFCKLLAGYEEIDTEGTLRKVVNVSCEYRELLKAGELCLATGRRLEMQTTEGMGKGRYAGQAENTTDKVFAYIDKIDCEKGEELKKLIEMQLRHSVNSFHEKREAKYAAVISICKVLAYAPAFLNIVLYMIYPFVASGLSLLTEYSEEIKAFTR